MKYFFSMVALVFAACMTHAQWANDQGVPAFHPAPPAKGQKLPAVMTGEQLDAYGLTTTAHKSSYRAAARRSAVVYQLPCYCYCDRNHGHSSLRSCFESTHGANCSTCMQEALYADKMSAKGWTAKQIRDGVIRGEFKQIDLQNPETVK